MKRIEYVRDSFWKDLAFVKNTTEFYICNYCGIFIVYCELVLCLKGKDRWQEWLDTMLLSALVMLLLECQKNCWIQLAKLDWGLILNWWKKWAFACKHIMMVANWTWARSDESLVGQAKILFPLYMCGAFLRTFQRTAVVCMYLILHFFQLEP